MPFLFTNEITMKTIYFLALSAILLSSCSDDSSETVIPQASEATITFDSRVGTSDFALNKDFTVGTRTYNFSKLRYWVSNIVLIDSKGAEYKVPDSYYLIEEVGDLDLSGTINDEMIYPAKKREAVTLKDIPTGDYKSVKFSIGIDSKYNDNLSLQTGELSIANGMSNIAWMWHTSYIFSSVGGTVKEGTTSKTFLAETGLNDNYKTVTINLTSPVNFESTKEVVLNVDITKVFDGIDIIQTPTINAMSTTLMSTVANNYATKAISFGTTK